MGRVMGLEPTAFWTTTRRSNQLSYTRLVGTYAVPSFCLDGKSFGLRLCSSSQKFKMQGILNFWFCGKNRGDYT